MVRFGRGWEADKRKWPKYNGFSDLGPGTRTSLNQTKTTALCKFIKVEVYGTSWGCFSGKSRLVEPRRGRPRNDEDIFWAFFGLQVAQNQSRCNSRAAKRLKTKRRCVMLLWVTIRTLSGAAKVRFGGGAWGAKIVKKSLFFSSWGTNFNGILHVEVGSNENSLDKQSLRIGPQLLFDVC